jgi:3-phenylpropionate/trans-cinnamate dioxygenase ferredoxin reductase subunit
MSLVAANPECIVIVGGGVAAQRCAFALRRLGFERAIEIVSGEGEMPYDRTLLSKDLLAAEDSQPCIPLSSRSQYEEADIQMRLDVRAVGLDIGASRLRLSSGEALHYDRLVLATGAHALIPPALDCRGVLTLRDVADLRRVHDALSRTRDLAIVGAGFIGCEVASAAVARNVAVTLIEGACAPLAGVFGDQIGDWLAALHREAGVDLRCGVPVRGVQRERDGFRISFGDGRELLADAVLVGVGMVPNVEWLIGSGVELDDGIVTDAACRTSVPGVFAAGDCARWYHPWYGEYLRVEHWDVAMRHGEAAAASALGSTEPFTPIPYFWSDQHGIKLQWVGYAPTWEDLEFDDAGEPRGFTARYRSAGELLGALSVERPHQCAEARRELDRIVRLRPGVVGGRS